MDLTDMNKDFSPAASKYTFLSATHGNFSKTNYISGHKVVMNIRK
jgi:hypothetical protein